MLLENKVKSLDPSCCFGYLTRVITSYVQMCFNAFDKAANLDVVDHPVLNFIYFLVCIFSQLTIHIDVSIHVCVCNYIYVLVCIDAYALIKLKNMGHHTFHINWNLVKCAQIRHMAE